MRQKSIKLPHSKTWKNVIICFFLGCCVRFFVSCGSLALRAQFLLNRNRNLHYGVCVYINILMVWCAGYRIVMKTLLRAYRKHAAHLLFHQKSVYIFIIVVQTWTFILFISFFHSPCSSSPRADAIRCLQRKVSMVSCRPMIRTSFERNVCPVIIFSNRLLNVPVHANAVFFKRSGLAAQWIHVVAWFEGGRDEGCCCFLHWSWECSIIENTPLE